MVETLKIGLRDYKNKFGTPNTTRRDMFKIKRKRCVTKIIAPFI